MQRHTHTGKKTGIEPSSTGQCTVWLCIKLYTVYPRNPHISMCVCACVCVCPSQVSEVSERGAGECSWSTQANSRQTKMYLCIVQQEGFGKHTERWKHWPLFLMTACRMHVPLSLLLRTALFFFCFFKMFLGMPLFQKHTVLSSSSSTGEKYLIFILFFLCQPFSLFPFTPLRLRLVSGLLVLKQEGVYEPGVCVCV